MPRPEVDAVADESSTDGSCGSGRDGHVIVFLEADATDDHRRAVEAVLAGSELVASYEFWDHEASLAEARELFCDHPAVLAKLESDEVRLPASYRVDLRDPDDADACAVRMEVEQLPGVLEAGVPDSQRLDRSPVGSPVDAGTAADSDVARRLFGCHPEMSEKVEDGAHVPASYRVSLRDPSVADKIAGRDEMADLPGVLDAVVV